MVVSAPAKSPATTYALDVVEGRIVAGPWVRLACARHLRDMERQGTADFAYVFDEEAEERIYRFAEMVNLGQDMPFVLEPFQRFIVGSLFGWVDRDGNRRFRTCYCEMGKGNGKTPLASFVGLAGMTVDGEAQAEIYWAAPTRNQAGIGFRDAKNMVEASPALRKRMEVLEHNISFGDSFMRTVSSEGRSLDGPRPHVSLIDEVHEHPNGTVVQKMRAGMKARRQPLVFEITNSGAGRTSICWEHHEHSRHVLEATIADETWFAYVCALDEGDDWHDEGVWPKTNPGIDSILTRTYLREQVKEADQIASARNVVLRLNFCIWTEQQQRWILMDLWDACDGRTVDEKLLKGERCWLGLDLASRRDFTAAALWFPELRAVAMRFWVPEEMKLRTVQQQQEIRVWAQKGLVKLTPGQVTDYDVVRDDILELARRFQVEEIPYDQWNATQLATQLQNAGAKCVPMQQGGAAMSEGCKELEALVASGELRHGGNEVLRWMASNVAARIDAQENIKLDRDGSGDKIDGIVALVMAIARAMLAEEKGDWVVR